MSPDINDDLWPEEPAGLREWQADGHERGQRYVDTGVCSCPWCMRKTLAAWRSTESRVHIPNANVQALVRPAGYVALAIRPADPDGLLGRGVIVLTLHVSSGFPTGPWTTWYVGDSGPVLGHYFDIEENAWADFWSRS